MKTFAVLAVGIVLVSIFFCPMVTAFPTTPADLQMVQPDPSLPKELSAFFGKWDSPKYFLIVEKIDEKKASLYMWQSVLSHTGMLYDAAKWHRFQAKVIPRPGFYSLRMRMASTCPFGDMEFFLQGEPLLMLSMDPNTAQAPGAPGKRTLRIELSRSPI